jgi:polyvinyl alcohol dehydrogenase (cytochrome)
VSGKPNCPEASGPDYDFGAGTVLAKTLDGRELVLAGQKSGIVWALDPDTGKPVWNTKVGRGGWAGGVLFGMAVVGDRVFVPINDEPSPTGEPPEHALPGLYTLDLGTGKLLGAVAAFNTCTGQPNCNPGYTSAVTATPEVILAGTNDGWLRAFDAASGNVLWSYNTVRDFKTLNDAPARGGAIRGPSAPLVYRGRLYMNSGYGLGGYVNKAGNVLLAFGVD